MLYFPTADYVYKNIDVQLPLNCSIQLCCFVVNEKTWPGIVKKLIKSQMQLVGQKLKILFLLSYIKPKKFSLYIIFLWGTRYIPSNIMKDKYNRRYIAKEWKNLWDIKHVYKNLCKKHPLKNWGEGWVIFSSPIVIQYSLKNLVNVFTIL